MLVIRGVVYSLILSINLMRIIIMGVWLCRTIFVHLRLLRRGLFKTH